MNFIRALTLAACIASPSVGISYAQVSYTTAETFIGLCVISDARFDAVEAFAATSRWKKPPAEAMPMLAPSTKPLRFEAWMFEQDGLPVFAAASTGMFEGHEVDSCVVAAKGTVSEVESALAAFDLTFVQEVDEVVQKVRVYTISRAGNRMLVTILFAPKDPNGVVIVSNTDLPESAF